MCSSSPSLPALSLCSPQWFVLRSIFDSRNPRSRIQIPILILNLTFVRPTVCVYLGIANESTEESFESLKESSDESSSEPIEEDLKLLRRVFTRSPTQSFAQPPANTIFEPHQRSINQERYSASTLSYKAIRTYTCAFYR